jgi:hypothetical protein
MSLPPLYQQEYTADTLDPQRSTRYVKTVNADEDAGIPVCELDFSVLGFPVSPVSSESSMSSNENKDGKRRGLLQRSQRSLRNLLGKPSYKEMSDSAFSELIEDASSPKEDMNDTRGMLTRSKGSKKKSDLKLQDDEDDRRNETKDRRSKSETVTTDTKDRTKHHKRVGSFDQLLGRESGRGSRSNDKGARPERRRPISGENLVKMSNSLRPEGRKTRSGDNLDRMRNSLRSEGQEPPIRPEGRKSKSGEHLERMSKSLRPEGRKTRSGDNLEKMRNSLRSEVQKPTSRRNIFRSNSFTMKGQKKEGRKDSSAKLLAQMVMAEFCDFED